MITVRRAARPVGPWAPALRVQAHGHRRAVTSTQRLQAHRPGSSRCRARRAREAAVQRGAGGCPPPTPPSAGPQQYDPPYAASRPAAGGAGGTSDAGGAVRGGAGRAAGGTGGRARAAGGSGSAAGAARGAEADSRAGGARAGAGRWRNKRLGCSGYSAARERFGLHQVHRVRASTMSRLHSRDQSGFCFETALRLFHELYQTIP
jgi:hypothetical protein